MEKKRVVSRAGMQSLEKCQFAAMENEEGTLPSRAEHPLCSCLGMGCSSLQFTAQWPRAVPVHSVSPGERWKHLAVCSPVGEVVMLCSDGR